MNKGKRIDDDIYDGFDHWGIKFKDEFRNKQENNVKILNEYNFIRKTKKILHLINSLYFSS